MKERDPRDELRDDDDKKRGDAGTGGEVEGQSEKMVERTSETTEKTTEKTDDKEGGKA